MNNLQALIKCRNLWQLLAITGSNDKYSYKPAKRWAHGCAACMKAGSTQYTDRNRNCNNCILLGYAWDNIARSSAFCESNSLYSYYRGWINNTAVSKYKRIYYANQIVNTCNKAIEDILVYGKLRRNYFSPIKENT